MGDLSRLNNLNYGDDDDDIFDDLEDDDFDPDYDSDGISRDVDEEEKRRIKNFLRDTETQESLRKIGVTDQNKQLDYYLRYHHHERDFEVPKITVEEVKAMQKMGVDISNTERLARLHYRVKMNGAAQFNDQYASRSRYKKESE